MPPSAIHLGLRRLSRPVRWAAGALLAAAAISYGVMLLMAYSQLTSQNSVLPDVKVLDKALFHFKDKPVSQIAQLLEATDLPMNGSGTMQPAFNTQSVGWEARLQNLNATGKTAVLAQREGERLALLDWVRSGSDPEAYERDDYPLSEAARINDITADYVTTGDGGANEGLRRRIRIRTLINDRCATCHSENGRNDKARWFPLDTYERLRPYCQAKPDAASRPTWPLAALLALVPLAGLGGPIFWFTSLPLPTRTTLTALPLAALAIAFGIWLLFPPSSHSIHVLIGFSAAAAIGILVQISASLNELFAGGPG